MKHTAIAGTVDKCHRPHCRYETSGEQVAENVAQRQHAIEPITGHLKSNDCMDRNYLKGALGANINALVCGCGVNNRKLIAAFCYPLIGWPESPE